MLLIYLIFNTNYSDIQLKKNFNVLRLINILRWILINLCCIFIYYSQYCKINLFVGRKVVLPLYIIKVYLASSVTYDKDNGLYLFIIIIIFIPYYISTFWNVYLYFVYVWIFCRDSNSDTATKRKFGTNFKLVLIDFVDMIYIYIKKYSGFGLNRMF